MTAERTTSFHSGLPELFNEFGRGLPQLNRVETVQLTDGTRIDVAHHMRFSPMDGGEFSVYDISVRRIMEHTDFTLGRLAGLLEVRLDGLYAESTGGVPLGALGQSFILRPDNMVNEMGGRDEFLRAGEEFVKWIREMWEAQAYKEPPIKIKS